MLCCVSYIWHMQNNTHMHMAHNYTETRGDIVQFDWGTEQNVWRTYNNGVRCFYVDVVENDPQPKQAFLEYSNAIDELSAQGGRAQATKMMRGGYCAPAAIAYITKTDIVDVVRNGIAQNRIMAAGIPGVTSNPNRWTGTKIVNVDGRTIERLAFGDMANPPVRFERVRITDKNKTAGRLAKNYPNDTFLVVHGGRSGTHAFAIDRGTHCDWEHKPKTRLCDIWRVVK